MSQLRVSGLSKAFGGLMAVTNVGFEIGPGQILGLIGRNGAGKTSVFNLFSGFLPPTNWTVVFEGMPTRKI